MEWECRLQAVARPRFKRRFTTRDPCRSSHPQLEKLECMREDGKVRVTVYFASAEYECRPVGGGDG
jgi:hypothetical protein